MDASSLRFGTPRFSSGVSVGVRAAGVCHAREEKEVTREGEIPARGSSLRTVHDREGGRVTLCRFDRERAQEVDKKERSVPAEGTLVLQGFTAAVGSALEAGGLWVRGAAWCARRGGTVMQ